MQYQTKSGHRAVSGIVTGVVVTFIGAMLLPDPALAGKRKKGHNPNGRPFVELAGAIVEVEGEVSSLQDQMDALVGRVESVEEAQATIQSVIADLEVENIELASQIAANADDVYSLETEISMLNSAILDLEAQIAANGDANGTLQAQIDAHEASVTTLALSIDTLQGDLQASINNNTDLIGLMQQQIAAMQQSQELYQLLVSGSCPDGQSIRQVNADGSVVCEVDDATSTATVTQYRVYGYAQTENGYAKITNSCPAGSILTGGGFRGNFGSSTELGGWPRLVWGDANGGAPESREYIAEVIGAQYAGVLFAQAICLQFN